jgi:hypothetical protein
MDTLFQKSARKKNPHRTLLKKGVHLSFCPGSCAEVESEGRPYTHVIFFCNLPTLPRERPSAPEAPPGCVGLAQLMPFVSRCATRLLLPLLVRKRGWKKAKELFCKRIHVKRCRIHLWRIPPKQKLILFSTCQPCPESALDGTELPPVALDSPSSCHSFRDAPRAFHSLNSFGKEGARWRKTEKIQKLNT